MDDEFLSKFLSIFIENSNKHFFLIYSLLRKISTTSWIWISQIHMIFVPLCYIGPIILLLSFRYFKPNSLMQKVTSHRLSIENKSSLNQVWFFFHHRKTTLGRSGINWLRWRKTGISFLTRVFLSKIGDKTICRKLL